METELVSFPISAFIQRCPEHTCIRDGIPFEALEEAPPPKAVVFLLWGESG